uniref:Ubiquitin carboxyl-terminal hydrolase 14 n=1 Tax=Spongospora subterranea TaxID=70186 RepID=A0A0H5RAQ2_9EUKA|eukprot:CRZ10846.1 hypothetical protein [Spongospora subterranea]
MTVHCQHLVSAIPSSFAPPDPSTVVLNHECSQCFHTPEAESGLFICTQCFNGGCLDHAKRHAEVSSHTIALHSSRHLIPVQPDSARPQKVTKLAIGGEGGFPLPSSPAFKQVTSFRCMVCPDAPEKETAGFESFVDAALNHKSLADQATIESWEEERISCDHVRNLSQIFNVAPLNKSSSHCNECDLSDNLWLCMTCGFLGCGRSIYGGGGGNDHAVNHNKSTGHAVVCKLGTISAEGTADIFCYSCDEMRLDPNLSDHMKTFGIVLNDMVKTSKTMAEMELEQNLKHEWSRVIEDGVAMVSLFGAGHTGLRNLGNSCYIASVIQLLFSLPSFIQRYFIEGQVHIQSCTSRQPWTCYHCQMAKLAHGLWSGKYSQPADENEIVSKNGVVPAMFKRLITESHSQFRGSRQQDALEFFQYLLQQIRQNEHRTGIDPTAPFEFALEDRLECSKCHHVRYRTLKTTDISIEIPDIHKDGGVSILDCLNRFVLPSPTEFSCPVCNERTIAEITLRVQTFPDYLLVGTRRFVFTDWVPRKLNTKIDVPSGVIDFESLRSRGQQPDELKFPEHESSPNKFCPNPDFLSQLIAMGFGENACSRSLQAVGNAGVEPAMNWLFEHGADADINDPIDIANSESGGSFDSGSVDALAAMGFDSSRCRHALKETNGDMERALDWLFSHVDDAIPSGTDVPALPGSLGPANYKLIGAITHLGESTSFGHYVAHVYRHEDNRWVYFNDDKVSEVAKLPIESAYIYCFQREI